MATGAEPGLTPGAMMGVRLAPDDARHIRCEPQVQQGARRIVLDQDLETSNLGDTANDPCHGTPPFITLKDVSVTYPNGTAALRPLDLSIAEDQVTVLLGPSGAGKSTLLRALNHLVRPTTGQVNVRGFGDLRSTATLRTFRRQAGMVFQQHQLIGRLSALQNVLLGRLGHHSFWRTLLPLADAERRWALECLDRVGLFEKALTRCDSLSGGQQQRVGIARALAQKPKLILADEPVASLDPAASERVLSLIREICKQDKIPAVISLHQLEYARIYADRIVGLALGKVVFDGPPEALSDGVLKQIYGASEETTQLKPAQPELQPPAAPPPLEAEDHKTPHIQPQAQTGVAS